MLKGLKRSNPIRSVIQTKKFNIQEENVCRDAKENKVAQMFITWYPEAITKRTYCIMSNHVHILLKLDFKILSIFMRELNSIYATYYNCKYAQSGHVFQGRFFSGTVETEGYLFSCIRYIHNNPVKAYMVSSILDYPFSSAEEYMRTMDDSEKKTKGCISGEVFSLLKQRFRNKREFLDFHDLFDNQEFIDIKEEKEEYDFLRVKQQLEIYTNENNIKSFKLLNSIPYMRNRAVEFCKNETGLPELKIENFLMILAKGA